MEYKVCHRCKESLSVNEFRIRVDKRETPYLIYLNNTCKKCDREKQIEVYYNRLKQEGYREEYNEYYKNLYHKNRESRVFKQKQYRNKESAKQVRKEYISKNKKKIFEQEAVCKRRYSQKHMENLTDEYVIRKLIGKHGTLKKEDFLQYPEIIEAKRLQIKLLRLINK